MKIGYSIPSNQGVEDPNALVQLAVLAEKLGCSSVWASEHLFHSSYIAERLGDLPYWEPLTILTAVASASVVSAMVVTCTPFRPHASAILA